jgi:hypothetical protein
VTEQEFAKLAMSIGRMCKAHDDLLRVAGGNPATMTEVAAQVEASELTVIAWLRAAAAITET